MSRYSRKDFLKTSAVGLTGISILSDLFSDEKSFDDEKLGVALVGLGSYARGQLAPALQQTQYCELRAIVTGTPEKEVVWADRYNIPEENIYSYRSMEQIADNPSVDIVYIVLPNGMHAEFAIKAAEAGKHVICEKPMATKVADAERMITAAKNNNVKLSIGYRLHFEPHHQRIMKWAKEKPFGKIEQIKTGNGFVVSWPYHWRLNKFLAGGGPLMDMGIYAVQGSVYAAGELPESVTAEYVSTGDQELFHDVESVIDWTFHFPSGVTSECSSTYTDNISFLDIQAEGGSYGLKTAYYYGGQRGYSPNGSFRLKQVNQQQRQMDDFARAILDDRPTPVPGEMGLRDVILLESIYKAAESGEEVSLDL